MLISVMLIKNIQMMFTIFDSLSVHLQKSKKPRTHHDWFLINCSSSLNYKGPGLRTLSSQLGKVFPKSILGTASKVPKYGVFLVRTVDSN